MPAQNHLFGKAISFYRAGDCETARRLLLGVLHNDNTNQAAWIWYAETFSSMEERLDIYCQALARHPHMYQVQRAYEYLQRHQPAQTVPGAKTNPTPSLRRLNAEINRGAAQPRKGQTPRSQHVRSDTQRPGWISAAWSVLSLLLIVALLASTFLYRQNALEQRQKTVVLQQENSRLISQFQAALVSLMQVRQDFQALQGRFDTLSAQHTDLQKRFKGLTQQYSALSSEHEQLQSKYRALNDTYNVLSDQHRALENRYATLTNNYADLSSKAVVPPYITVNERKVTMAFYKRDHSILHWTVPFTSLENDIERGYSSRKSLFSSKAGLTLQGNNGKKYHVVDFRSYVDASAFSSVIQDLYNQSANEDEFIREVWNIITQLTTYASDPDVETPRYPLETLLAGGGDCEDTAILFASMIKAAPVSWSVKLVYLNAYHPNDASDPNHVMVEVNTGAANYLVETTSNNNMTPYPKGVSGWFLELP